MTGKSNKGKGKRRSQAKFCSRRRWRPKQDRYCKYHNGEKKVPPREVEAKATKAKAKDEVRKNFVRA